MVIDDPEVLQIIAWLWKKVIDGNFPEEGRVDIHAIVRGLEQGVKALEAARQAAVKPLENLDWIITELRTIQKRLTNIEDVVRKQAVQRGDIHAWIQELAHTSPIPGGNRGQ